MSSQDLQLWTPIAALVVAATSAFFGLRTYRHAARTKAAEFLMALHQAFFVAETYKKVRNTLDDRSASSRREVARYMSEEPYEFTDFLNFFELVAFMRKERTLNEAQVEALLGYYLQILTDTPELREYIGNEQKNFEHLDELLSRRAR